VTLTLTSDDLESHIIMNVLSTLTNTTIWFVAASCLIVDVRTTNVRTDVRTDGRTLLQRLLGPLRRWPNEADTRMVHWWALIDIIHLIWTGQSPPSSSVQCNENTATDMDVMASVMISEGSIVDVGTRGASPTTAEWARFSVQVYTLFWG